MTAPAITLSPEPEVLPVSEPELVAIANALLKQLDDVQGERAANQKALQVEYELLDLPLARREAGIEAYLLRIAEGLKALDAFRGKKFRELPRGKIGWQHTNARLEVENEEATLTWILTQDDSVVAQVSKVEQRRKILKKELDAYCLPLGVVPTGCKLIEEGERFRATPERRAPDRA